MEHLNLIDRHWIRFNKRKRNHCILCLPGRGNHGIELARIYKLMGLNALIIGVTPAMRQWYTQPNGVKDQEAAVNGLELAVTEIEKVIKKIEQRYGITRNKITLSGYSAGGVMALLVGMYSSLLFNCVVSHSGAILDTDMVPICKFSQCPILLTHSQDDIIFDWQERYLPMLESLQINGYPVYTATETDIGHGVSKRQFLISKRFIEFNQQMI